MMILPGKRHAYGDYQPYFQQRMWDFFVEHLMGEPPNQAPTFTRRGRLRR